MNSLGHHLSKKGFKDVRSIFCSMKFISRKVENMYQGLPSLSLIQFVLNLCACVWAVGGFFNVSRLLCGLKQIILFNSIVCN